MSLNDHLIFPDPLLSLTIEDVIAVLKCASDEAGTTVPPDTTADCRVADVMWVSLWSESIKFMVPDNRCGVSESEVLAVSVKLPVADEDVKVGL